MDLDSWHLLEYFHLNRGVRVLVHRERINDSGFYIGRTAARQAGTTAKDYARDLAEEFFQKHPHLCADKQRWLLVVWRLDRKNDQQRDKVCEVRGTSGQAPPETELAGPALAGGTPP
ncbi:hypothetical protein [Streptoalloteichus hindustanus]|uniref:Uncharacterized protein n=1 Tax=Streptoalloteichus hindustanus TaxID=2017 RepID=A0A1M4YDL4_STRHI|nr:hypothetical protein [Streptoalloteichus hindustanus]SHF03728.1 hypothetical protein SAMN05444320_102320 [Streptoalloteichus hindustanus]